MIHTKKATYKLIFLPFHKKNEIGTLFPISNIKKNIFSHIHINNLRFLFIYIITEFKKIQKLFQLNYSLLLKNIIIKVSNNKNEQHKIAF